MYMFTLGLLRANCHRKFVIFPRAKQPRGTVVRALVLQFEDPGYKTHTQPLTRFVLSISMYKSLNMDAAFTQMRDLLPVGNIDYLLFITSFFCSRNDARAHFKEYVTLPSARVNNYHLLLFPLAQLQVLGKQLARENALFYKILHKWLILWN